MSTSDEDRLRAGILARQRAEADDVLRRAAEPSDEELRYFALCRYDVLSEVHAIRELLASDRMIISRTLEPTDALMNALVAKGRRVGQSLFDKGGFQLMKWVVDTFVPPMQHLMMEHAFSGVGGRYARSLRGL